MSDIRQARIQQGRSQKEVARDAGINPRTLRKIESGEHVSEVSLQAVQRVLAIHGHHAAPARWPRLKPDLADIAALAFPVALLGVGASIWMLSVHLAVGIMAFGTVLSLLLLAAWLQPCPPNTTIVISTDNSSVPRHLLSDPLLAARSWLGVKNLCVRQFKADGDRLTYVILADLDSADYADVATRLRSKGLEATVATA